jgi:hypothetical protein
MRVQTCCLSLLFCGLAVASEPDSVTGWIPDRVHPQVQYRLKCFRGALTVEWRNAYPGAVTLKANFRSSSYDGDEQVTIPPGGSATSQPETMNCFAASFDIREEHFVMAAPPPPALAKPDAEIPEKAPTPAAPLVAPWIPPTKLTEVTTEALASIHAGMKRDEVLRRIGSPLSKLAIPEENELVETYRYAISRGRAATVHFSNGIVTDVQVSPP